MSLVPFKWPAFAAALGIAALMAPLRAGADDKPSTKKPAPGEFLLCDVGDGMSLPGNPLPEETMPWGKHRGPASFWSRRWTAPPVIRTISS